MTELRAHMVVDGGVAAMAGLRRARRLCRTARAAAGLVRRRLALACRVRVGGGCVRGGGT